MTLIVLPTLPAMSEVQLVSRGMGMCMCIRLLIVTTIIDVRVYLTESMGGVLGANVMRDHNVVFDYDNHLVGFAEGICDYKAESLDSVPGGNGAEVCGHG